MDYTELIAQLRALGIPDWATARHMMAEAATAIEALQARVTQLEERLDCDRAILAARTASMERYVAERDALEAAINCYSPDDSATDWADKIRKLMEGL